MLGLGLGWVIAALLLISSNPREMSEHQIETKARELGMVYPHEVVVFQEEEAAHPR